MHFLTVDHVNGISNEPRVEFRVRATTLYRRLRNAGYPAGFQLLCNNCNWAKGVFGMCPHKGEFPTKDGFTLTPRQKKTIEAEADVPQRGMYLLEENR